MGEKNQQPQKYKENAYGGHNGSIKGTTTTKEGGAITTVFHT